MRTWNTILALCLFTAVPAFADTNTPAAEPSVANTAAMPALRSDRREDVQRKLERFLAENISILSSTGIRIMNRWETTGKEIWNQRYAGITADFGIEGDHVENVLWRLDNGQVDKIDPKVVMLMIGTNNSGKNTAAEIADGIRVLVAEYEKRCPHAHIILMGIFPRGQHAEDGGRRKVAAVNSQIKSLEGERVTFIDISPKLIGADGQISPAMMPDFVHPTAQGYQIWSDAIQPVIEKYVTAK